MPTHYRHIRSPRKITAEKYDHLIAKSVDIFSRYPGIRSIRQYGSVTIPGISDLDILLIFENDAPGLDGDWRMQFTREEEYIFLHSPTALPVNSFQYVRYLTHLPKTVTLWGDSMEPESLSDLEKEFLHPLIALEHSLRLLVSFLNQLNLGIIKQRPTLCAIHSLRFDLEIMGSEGNPAAEDVPKKMERLRRNWYSVDETEKQVELAALLEAAFNLEMAVLNSLSHWSRQIFEARPNISMLRIPSAWPGINFLCQEYGKNEIEIAFFNVGIMKFLSLFPLTTLQLKTYSRLQKMDIKLPAHTFGLLAGSTGQLKPEYRPIQEKRRALSLEVSSFSDQLKGGFGKMHTPPFEYLPR